MKGTYEDEFPLLAAYKLYAANIRGDGNCLFNALSDQIYGHQDEHHTIRARVIQHMRENADHYKGFIDTHPGGGYRRNPKRKNAGVYSSPVTIAPVSDEDVDRVFEQHLKMMSKGGAWGDNIEIHAFAAAFGIDVKIYQAEFAYMVQAPEPSSPRRIAHIAYHTWEHYSSIRNTNGPHTGLPEVHELELSSEAEAENNAAAAKMDYALPWKIKLVHESLPYFADRETIRSVLQEYKGDTNLVVTALLDAEERASVSSQHGSSSTERDQDSDDESQFSGASKKQNRRLSVAAKLKQKQQREAEVIDTPPIEASESRSPEATLALRPIKKMVPSVSRARRVVTDSDDDWHPDSDEERDGHDPKAASVSRSGPLRAQRTSSPAASAQQTNKTTIKITYTPPAPSSEISQKHAGSQQQQKPLSRAKEVALKKAAQKAAHKERIKASLTTASSNLNNIGPPLEIRAGIKTLYI